MRSNIKDSNGIWNKAEQSAEEQRKQNDFIYNKRGLGYFVTKGAKTQILKARKKAFMDERLPELFRQMRLLGITLDDIRKAYEDTAESGE